MDDTCGYIYILTNPSFKEYVKIGYADDVQKRLKQLNRSECIPFAFRVYATYEVNSRLSDMKIHSIIDKLNPNLRSIETFDGKKRVREFYAMPPEDAYSILEAIAEIHGRTDKLVKVEPTVSEEEEETIADEIEAEQRERWAPFKFSMCEGELWFLSTLAKKLLNSKWPVAGPRYFKYEGQWLNDLREQRENNH